MTLTQKQKADKAYRRKHKKQIAAWVAAYYRKHKKQIAAWAAAYRRKNKKRVAARAAAYYRKNKAKIAAQRAAYYCKNKKQIARRNAAYRRKNKNKKRLVAYYRKNKKQIMRQKAAWRCKHPEWIKARDHQRRALKLRLPSIAHITPMPRDHKCPVCRARLRRGTSHAPHIDHFKPLSRGGHHVPSNTWIICEMCNLKKNAGTIAELCKKVGVTLAPVLR